MKNLLPLILCCFFLTSYSQVHTSMPPEAKSFYQKAMQSLKPEIKYEVEKMASKLKGRNVNADSLSGEIKKDPVLKKYDQAKIDALTILVLVQASKNADEDLKKIVMTMQDDKNHPNTSFDKTKPLIEHKSQLAKNLNEAMAKMNNMEW